MKIKSLSAVYLLLAQLMVAINVVGSRFLATHASTLSVLFVRFFIAMVFLGIANGIKPQKSLPLKQLTNKEWGLIIGQALTAGVLFNALMLLGLKYTSASVAGMIISVLPAVIAVAAVLLLKEHLSRTNTMCIALAILGLLIINGQHLSQGEHHSLLGDAIVLLALVPEAAYYILSRFYQNRLSLLMLSALMNGINVILLLPLLLLTGIHQVIEIDMHSLQILLITGLASGFFYIFWYVGSQSIPATIAGLYTAIGPIFIMLIASVFLHESVSATELIGMVCIILSILVTGMKRRTFTDLKVS